MTMETPELAKRITQWERRRIMRAEGLRFEFDNRCFLLEWSPVQDDEEPPTFFDAWLGELVGSDEVPWDRVMFTVHLDDDGQPTDMCMNDGSVFTGEVVIVWKADGARDFEVLNWSEYDGENAELVRLIADRSDFRSIVREWIINAGAAGLTTRHNPELNHCDRWRFGKPPGG